MSRSNRLQLRIRGASRGMDLDAAIRAGATVEWRNPDQKRDEWRGPEPLEDAIEESSEGFRVAVENALERAAGFKPRPTPKPKRKRVSRKRRLAALKGWRTRRRKERARKSRRKSSRRKRR